MESAAPTITIDFHDGRKIERTVTGNSIHFFFSSRRRHTSYWRDWSSDVCSSDLGPERVDERGHIGNLIVGQRELRHAGTAGADDRRHQLALLIVEDNSRAQQAGSAVAAARVRAVAELTVHAVERFAALDRRGIRGRTIRVVAPLRTGAQG